MRIFDETLTMELTDPDLEKGQLSPARLLVAHHPAVEAVVHYEVMEGTVTDDCPDGLRREVVDTPAAEAWDEYEDVQMYIPYTEAELTERAEKAAAEAAEEEARRAAAEEAAKQAAEQAAKIARIDAIDAQVTYTAMMTDTLMEVESDV